MTLMAFPGSLPDDLEVPRGGCELGGSRCVHPAELEVQVPDLGSVRQLCRDHAGYFMLAAAGAERPARVLVTKIVAEGEREGEGFRRSDGPASRHGRR